MENEEIMTTNNEDLEVTYLEPEEIEEGGSIGKIVAVGAGIVAAGAGIALAVKKLGPKFTERKIKSLEKKGYRVFKEDDIQDVVEVDVEDNFEFEEPEEESKPEEKKKK